MKDIANGQPFDRGRAFRHFAYSLIFLRNDELLTSETTAPDKDVQVPIRAATPLWALPRPTPELLDEGRSAIPV